ncbi:GRB10-interacting GYF protein 2-like [Patiria miniata]|uniref:Uncharacterized protein n=1 Tax=Patiria miniata TaxID=46514 RepID=A0A914AI71_PATMI|nr:GRB10-interacting GYF protein 2-like [Patiria miniata]
MRKRAMESFSETDKRLKSEEEDKQMRKRNTGSDASLFLLKKLEMDREMKERKLELKREEAQRRQEKEEREEERRRQDEERRREKEEREEDRRRRDEEMRRDREEREETRRRRDEADREKRMELLQQQLMQQNQMIVMLLKNKHEK